VGVPPPVPPTVTVQGVPSTNELVGRSRDWLKIKFEKGKPKEYIEAVKASIKGSSGQSSSIAQGPSAQELTGQLKVVRDIGDVPREIAQIPAGTTRSGATFRQTDTPEMSFMVSQATSGQRTPSGAIIMLPEFKPDM
jgi:hypothetical protein